MAPLCQKQSYRFARMLGASMVALTQGSRSRGVVDRTIGTFQDLVDSKSLFLTANTESIYYATWILLGMWREGLRGRFGAGLPWWRRPIHVAAPAGPDRK
jgi:hypothetical protein